MRWTEIMYETLSQSVTAGHYWRKMSTWMYKYLVHLMLWARSVCSAAPEVLSGGPYNHAADWWSLGILLFSLVNGKVRSCRWIHNYFTHSFVKSGVSVLPYQTQSLALWELGHPVFSCFSSPCLQNQTTAVCSGKCGVFLMKCPSASAPLWPCS